MSKATISPLDHANSRLNEAFKRLEQAITHANSAAPTPISAEDRAAIEAEITASWKKQSTSLNNQIASLQAENEALRKENVSLSNQLKDVQQDYIELQQISHQVADGIDEQAKQLDLIAHVYASA